jgi:hypothetical protein
MIAKYTVMKDDTAIYKDGQAIEGCDMSGLSDDFHALQWYGTKGHIEYSDEMKSNLHISSESELEAGCGISLSTIIERRTARIAEIEAELPEASPVWAQARGKAYPYIGEQLDLLFHDMAAGKGTKDGEWYKAVAKVKTDNPKSSI